MNSIQSWNDLPVAAPIDPRTVVANAFTDATQGVFKRSTTFLQTSWAANPWVFTGLASCTSLHSDDFLEINDAIQWTFSHQIVNPSSTLAIPMRKVMFMRGGTQWEMDITIDFGADTYTDIELTLRDNAATSGDALSTSLGTMPVISFAGNFTGQHSFRVTISQFGRMSMVLLAKDITSSPLYSMFEMEWVVVP
ncbi:MAG TPA: hypothetical protein VEW28_02550 [Candidatus Kapabacteria bacterium]|nr:hypothetical protein [Candidatus Kapabacteria bacterium]